LSPRGKEGERAEGKKGKREKGKKGKEKRKHVKSKVDNITEQREEL